MGAAGPRVVVAVPVYNHAATLRAVAAGCLAQGYPVIVADDGSTDGSSERVVGLPVECLRLPKNRGKGQAILAAAERAHDLGYEAMVTIDADGQHDPLDLGRLIEGAMAAWPSIAVGARRMDGPNVPRSSLFGRDFSNFWVRLECGRILPDTQSGYRVYPVTLLTSFRFVARRYAFEIEALVRGSWAGFPIVSIPVDVYYPPDGERITHFRMFWDNLRLSGIHAYLLARSLLPWPHRRLVHAASLAGVAALRKLARDAFRSPRAFLRRLSRERSSALELAAAAWVGVAVGSLPIMPFGIATIVYVCGRLRLNPLAAVGASNLCIPPFVPFLCIEVGHLLRYGQFWSDFSWRAIGSQLPQRLLEWLLGSLVMGPLLGLVAGFATYVLVRALRSPKG